MVALGAYKIHDTAVCAWIKQWWRWGEYGATCSIFYYPETDSPYVSSFEEVSYEWHLGEMIWLLEVFRAQIGQRRPGEVAGFSRPYDRIHFFSNWWYWSRDVDF